MASLGLQSLPMLETYFLKAVSRGDTKEAERLKQQIIDIKSQIAPSRVDLDSGVFLGSVDKPLYQFLS